MAIRRRKAARCFLGDVPELEADHAVGLSLGLDLRSSFVVVGYRFTPEVLASNLPNMHSIVFGLTLS